MKNYYEELQKYNIRTYGYDVIELTKCLSPAMADRFAAATETMQNEADRALVQACYTIFMQMRSVTSTGQMMLDDKTIETQQQRILAGEDK